MPTEWIFAADTFINTRVLNTTFGTFNTAAIAISFFMIKKTDTYINDMGINKPYSTHHLLQKTHHKVRIIISKFNNFNKNDKFYLSNIILLSFSTSRSRMDTGFRNTHFKCIAISSRVIQA